ncbi:ATP-dependent DNA helicase Q-like 5 isoform X1 [Prosopis cineraria]|uniref:ATP-dependent DNA helicase Q-like 5 isoform X1 n=1 Tax=Prosopis cineraria TaxID=364024 RepID=UPI00240F1E7E|nr:ATP-dependent DNA helicase Q-like 5 isoform X1 [Prosopis cineraria]
MDSDSDSDASHVSATPPREEPPSALPSHPPPPTKKPVLVPNKLKSSSSSCLKYSKPKLRSSRPTKASSKPEFTQEELPGNSFGHPTPPFQIRRPSDCVTQLSTAQYFETLPAGYFSKSVSFSKIRRPFLSFADSSGNEPPLDFASNPGLKNESNESYYQQGDSIPLGLEGKSLSARNMTKLGKRHPNLIGANVPAPSIKVRKCGSEGNFVRLNLNSKRWKSRNRGKKKNFAYSKRRSYMRDKVKSKHEDEDQMQSVYEPKEDTFVVRTAQKKSRDPRGTKEFNCEMIEEAISAVRDVPSDENLVKLLQLVYGHDAFRDGQLEAIKLVLAGKSTMLILPTGAGKSLCYQLPAMILPGITLVVSPLVALMIDQQRKLPPMINGGFLCSSQTPEESSETLKQLQEGALKVLFVSPERLLNEEFMSVISSSSTVSLVVVDEAHCISEWSHNFRPSFMRLRASFLRNKLNAGSILAMTATATAITLNSIMSALDIPCTNLIQKTKLSDNLHLSVSLARNRMKDLLMLIKSPPYVEVQSIIIYCKFQSEADIISKYLSDNNISAKSYHSSIPAKERSYVQELFGSNKIRVVVATVAFGMGLDKRDVGAVIHYSLPESPEHYVQEIGRAGRDGRLSFCHLFYDDETYVKLRSLMYSDGVDEYAVNKFLCEVFPADRISNGQICSLIKESASRRFDIKEEVMLTLLTRLELGNVQYIRLLPQINTTCTLSFHKTLPTLLAQKDSAVAAILKRSENKQGLYVFDMPSVANDMGVTVVELSNQLHNLKLLGEITFDTKDSAYCYIIVKAPTDFFSLSADLTRWLYEFEGSKVRKLDAMFDAAYHAVNICDKMPGCSSSNHTPCLQRKILDYFAGVDNNSMYKKLDQSSPFLRADIKVFLQSNSQAKFTPRAIARIMHGIASPAYPSAVWSKTHFWGRYRHADFQAVMEAAKEELKNFVGKDGSSSHLR